MQKLHGAALLLYRQCCNPDGNEAILTEGQAVARMGDNVKEEIAIAPAMDEMGGRRSPERQPADNKWAGVEREVLVAIRAVLPDQADRFDLLESPS